jgi:hypothetical protein
VLSGKRLIAKGIGHLRLSLDNIKRSVSPFIDSGSKLPTGERRIMSIITKIAANSMQSKHKEMF